MKTTSLFSSLTPVLALASMVASVGCSQPIIEDYGYEDDDSSESATTKKKTNSKKTSSNNSDSDTNTDTSSGTDTSTPPDDTSTPPPPSGDPDDPFACFDQCAASGPAAQYWSCSESCQDQRCDDNCWFQSCGGSKEQSCIQALDACDDQCGNPFGGGQ